jgi:hypothetical protein
LESEDSSSSSSSSSSSDYVAVRLLDADGFGVLESSDSSDRRKRSVSLSYATSDEEFSVHTGPIFHAEGVNADVVRKAGFRLGVHNKMQPKHDPIVDPLRAGIDFDGDDSTSSSYSFKSSWSKPTEKDECLKALFHRRRDHARAQASLVVYMRLMKERERQPCLLDRLSSSSSSLSSSSSSSTSNSLRSHVQKHAMERVNKFAAHAAPAHDATEQHDSDSFAPNVKGLRLDAELS